MAGIELTDEMRAAFLADHEDACDGIGCGRAACLDVRLAAVLAIVAREYVILPRGAQPICCREHPDRPVRWGQCGECISELPPEDRT